MSDITSTPPPAPRRGAPLWVQIVVWGLLFALLIIVAWTLNIRQQGAVKVGDTIPDFPLVFFDGYQYQGKSEVKLSDLKGKVVVRFIKIL